MTESSSTHKAKHDREQFAYLVETHGDAPDISEARAQIEREPERFDEIFNNLFRLESGARQEPLAINPELDVVSLEAEWKRGRPKIVVIDNLLTPAALAELRRFCWGSTVWRTAYPNGYLGAFLVDGFASPLLAQIAIELKSTLTGIIGNHGLIELWGFKYDQTLRGINIHADVAAVNINFWITPDEANLDPASGGLVVWDVPAPLDWGFAQYQNNGPGIRDFLTARGAHSVTVPYRSNRAVVFDSDLFHETDRFSFKDGYTNRRLNITLLYGWRNVDTGGQS